MLEVHPFGPSHDVLAWRTVGRGAGPSVIPLHTPLGVETGRGQLAARPLDLLHGDLPAREIRFWIDERERPSGRSGQPRKARRLAGRPSAGRRQPAILTTHPSLPAAEVAGLLRSRWAQENVFKTLRQEFGLDSLPQHAAQEVEPATLVVNPAMRVIEKALKKNRRQAGKLRREQSARTRRAAAQLLGRPAHARLPCRDAGRRDGGPAVGQARRRAQLRQGAVPMRRQLAAARGGRHPARATAASGHASPGRGRCGPVRATQRMPRRAGPLRSAWKLVGRKAATQGDAPLSSHTNCDLSTAKTSGS